jgi:hypothetical protein
LGLIKESATVLPSCNSEVASDQLSSFKLFAAVNKSFTACSVSGLSSVARAYTREKLNAAIAGADTLQAAISLFKIIPAIGIGVSLVDIGDTINNWDNKSTLELR